MPSILEIGQLTEGEASVSTLYKVALSLIEASEADEAGWTSVHIPYSSQGEISVTFHPHKGLQIFESFSGADDPTVNWLINEIAPTYPILITDPQGSVLRNEVDGEDEFNSERAPAVYQKILEEVCCRGCVDIILPALHNQLLEQDKRVEWVKLTELTQLKLEVIDGVGMQVSLVEVESAPDDNPTPPVEAVIPICSIGTTGKVSFGGSSLLNLFPALLHHVAKP